MKLAIFDLGQVCIHTHYERSYEAWEKLAGLPQNSIPRTALEVEEHYRYERGESDCRSFAAWFCERFSLSLSYEQWVEGWNAMFHGVIGPTETVVRGLRDQGVRLAILSNTNLCHYRCWSQDYADFVGLFDQLYVSHEMGLRKPDPKIYETLLQREGVAAGDAVFFDDKIENIEAARACGIDSIHCTAEESAYDWWQQQQRSR